MAKPTKEAPITSDSAQDEAIEALCVAIRAMKKQLVLIERGKAKSNGHDPSDRIAFQAKAIATTVDAIRKIEKDRARKLESITPATVLAWFRAQDPTERARIVRELQQLDSGRSGLA